MVGECSHLPSVAYFEFGVPGIRGGRSERSSPLASDLTSFFAGGKKRLLLKGDVARKAMKQEKIEDFPAVEDLRKREKKRGLGSPSCV
jgi:hypothetical protein